MLTLITLFLLRKIQNYVPVVTLSAQKLSKLLRKEFEKLVYCNECKTKSKNKNTTNEYNIMNIITNQILLESIDYLL